MVLTLTDRKTQRILPMTRRILPMTQRTKHV
jgi:hypothetical protein